MNCTYILDISPVLVALFANTFCHSIGCLFFFVAGLLSCAKSF